MLVKDGLHNMLIPKLVKENRSRDSRVQREAPTSNRKASLSIGHAGPEHAETSLDSIQKWPESRLHSKDPREKERKQRQDSRKTIAPADLQARCQVKRSETQLQE